jgi:hypothetical protein
VIVAISRRGPPQSGQVRTSTANTRRKSSTQRSLRVLAGLDSTAGESGGLEVASRLEHAGEHAAAGRIAAAGRPEVLALGSVEPWCDSFDARGPGTILSRHWAAGASTSW